jgi:hypothetical protein
MAILVNEPAIGTRIVSAIQEHHSRVVGGTGPRNGIHLVREATLRGSQSLR